jgi:hypothetical protein
MGLEADDNILAPPKQIQKQNTRLPSSFILNQLSKESMLLSLLNLF